MLVTRGVPHCLAGLLLSNLAMTSALSFDLQGHRGARGLFPENSLPAFARALEIGVTTLELDVGITRDGVVVVSHDSRLNPDITRDASGRWIPTPGPPLYQLTLTELQRHDVGRINPNSAYASKFPKQRPVDSTRIPTLVEVVALTRESGNRAIRFNIETKLTPHAPELTAPPDQFADGLIEALHALGIADRTTIQSFDWRILQRTQQIAPDIPTVYLTARQSWLNNLESDKSGVSPWTAGFDSNKFGGSVPQMIKSAGGSIWAPYHGDLTAADVDEAHKHGLSVLVWTVNQHQDVERMIDLGVDGIISDYPDRVRQVMQRKGMTLPPATPVNPERSN